MKLNLIATLFIATGLVFATTSDLYAKGRKGGGKPAPKKVIPPNHSKVTAISDTSITVSTKGGSQTFSIGEFTTIYVDGVRSKASDIREGMLAMVGGDSSKKATTITAKAAPAK